MLRWLRIWLITDPCAAAWVVLMGCTTTIANLLDRRGNLGHRVAAFWSRLLMLTSGFQTSVEGTENVPRRGAFILVANHESMLDIPLLMACVPASFRFMAKRSLCRMPFVGWHLVLGGHVRVDREDKRAAVKVMADARKLLERGVPVVIFAEGSRSTTGLRAFKGGAAHLAIRTGCPVLPVGLVGTRKALPRGSMHIRPASVAVRVGEMVSTAGLGKQDAESLTRTLQARVRELIAQPMPAEAACTSR